MDIPRCPLELEPPRSPLLIFSETPLRGASSLIPNPPEQLYPIREALLREEPIDLHSWVASPTGGLLEPGDGWVPF
jgi:hypothetical protein